MRCRPGVLLHYSLPLGRRKCSRGRLSAPCGCNASSPPCGTPSSPRHQHRASPCQPLIWCSATIAIPAAWSVTRRTAARSIHQQRRLCESARCRAQSTARTSTGSAACRGPRCITAIHRGEGLSSEATPQVQRAAPATNEGVSAQTELGCLAFGRRGRLGSGVIWCTTEVTREV